MQLKVRRTLTPALSQREREKLSPVFGRSLNGDRIRALPAGFPLLGVRVRVRGNDASNCIDTA